MHIIREMVRLLLFFFAILQFAHGSSCPKGFDLVRDGECRGYAATMSVPVYQAMSKAVEKCSTIKDGHSVYIHDEEHQTYWKGKAPATTDGYLILGLVCEKISTKWKWADGSALDFKPPKNLYSPELDKPCTVGFSWYMRPDGYWNYGGQGGNISAYIYCTTQLQQTADFDDNCQDKVCYQVSEGAENWQDGQKFCQNSAANLASIHNSKTNEYVRSLAAAYRAHNGVFIGASAVGNSTFSWIDRSTMDYENYTPGFPKSSAGQWLGECVAMDTSSTGQWITGDEWINGGEWMNVDCKAKLPVVCARSEFSTYQPTCDEGETWKEGTVITSPGFPSSASTACDYFLTAAAGKKVQVEILDLQANSCCDSLVLYDGQVGGAVIAKLTGEARNATYTTKSSNVMRVSWLPNGGKNVKGVSMSFRGV